MAYTDAYLLLVTFISLSDPFLQLICVRLSVVSCLWRRMKLKFDVASYEVHLSVMSYKVLLLVASHEVLLSVAPYEGLLSDRPSQLHLAAEVKDYFHSSLNLPMSCSIRLSILTGFVIIFR